MSVIGEFFRDPIGWTVQAGRLFVDEVSKQKPARKIGSVAVDLIESDPTGAGLVLTQSLSNPVQFSTLFVDEFPREQARVFRKVNKVIKTNPVVSFSRLVIFGVLLFAFFPMIFAVSRRVGKVIA